MAQGFVSLSWEVLFRCSDRSFGLCPPGTRKGDVVVVLCGASVPFVLRRRERKKGETQADVPYKLVGEAYVQGVMHGALVEKQRHGKMTEEQFILV